MPDPATNAELDALEAQIDAWADRELRENPVVAAVDRAEEPDVRRWYIRLRGEEKDTFTIWLTLRQRTLHYETYFMPGPEEDAGRLFEHLLRRNAGFNGVAFEIGVEDAIFLAGALPVQAVTDDELDRILGSLYAYTEQCFRPAMRIGFAGRFKG